MFLAAIVCSLQFREPPLLALHMEYLTSTLSRYELTWHVPSNRRKDKASYTYGGLEIKHTMNNYPSIAICAELKHPPYQKGAVKFQIREIRFDNFPFYKKRLEDDVKWMNTPSHAKTISEAARHRKVLEKAKQQALLLADTELFSEIRQLEQDYVSGQLKDGGLTYASGRKNTKLMRLLLESGAPIEAASLLNTSIKQLCLELNYAEGAELLETYHIALQPNYSISNLSINYVAAQPEPTADLSEVTAQPTLARNLTSI